MYKIIITKNNVITNEAKFESLESLNEWKNYHVSIKTFQFEDVLVPASFDLDGNEIAPATVIPKTHSFEIIEVVDNSAQIVINKEALKFLAETDWLIIREVETGVPCPAEIKQARQEARDRVVKL